MQVVGIHDLTLSGQAASDVAHLLAELVENATSFSPPITTVQISGDPVGSGYVLEIEDRGIGMSDAELAEANGRLTAPSAVESALSRMMGFHVVGRLAARHGIAVQLRHSWSGGVAALGTRRRHRTLAGARMLPLRQASRSSRLRDHDGWL